MKIALVQPDWGNLGGAVSFVDHLYRGLVQAGHEVSCVAIRGKLGRSSSSLQYRDKPHVVFLGYGPKNYMSSAAFLNSHDVIHFTNPGLDVSDRKYFKTNPEPPYAALLDELHGRRIATEHDAMRDIRKWWPYSKRLGCQILVSVQKSRADEISSYGIAPSVEYVPNPYEGYTPRDSSTFESRPRRVIHAGRISHERHVHLLAFASPDIKGDVEIYGRPEGVYWYHYVRDAVVGRPVKLGGGFVADDIPRILQSTALVTDLFPYVEDGLGRNYSFFEACYYGAVPVLPAVRFSPYIVAGRNGVSVPELTPQSLADSVNLYLDQPDKLRDMRYANLEYIRHHAYDRTVSKYVELYRSLV